MLKWLLWLLCLGYFATSAVVLVNAFTWLPALPPPWYAVQKVLYWPFGWYFDLLEAWLGGSSIPYPLYALAVRGPFLLLSLAGLIALPRRRSRRQAA